MTETGDRAAVCPNVSFYGRPCTLPPHGWQQSCTFGPDPDPEENLAYDLENGSTLRDLLEAFSAGGPIAIMAAMRWVEYRMFRDARDAEQHIGGIVAQVRASAVTAAQSEQELVREYLEQRLSVTNGAPAAAGGDELGLMRLALRDANRLLYSLGQGPFLPGQGQLPYPRAELPMPRLGETEPVTLTAKCPGNCGDDSPHDSHLAPGALEYLAGEGANGAQLGLATTRRLLIELKSRGDGVCAELYDTAAGLIAHLPAKVLDYRTVDG